MPERVINALRHKQKSRWRLSTATSIALASAGQQLRGRLQGDSIGTKHTLGTYERRSEQILWVLNFEWRKERGGMLVEVSVPIDRLPRASA